MTKLTGIMASPGIAIGPALVFREEILSIPKYDIASRSIGAEIARFEEALSAARADLEQLRDAALAADKKTEQGILDSHLLMLADPEFMASVRRALERDLKNVEWVLVQVVEDMVDRLANMRDDYFLDRTSDFHDVSRRIMQHLLRRERPNLHELDREVVLVAQNLMPSDTVGLGGSAVLGIATDGGAKTSHTAILARSFEIPAVLGLSNVSRVVENGDQVIVDGNSGIVIVRPDEETLLRYRGEQERWHQHEITLNDLNRLPAETKDHKLVRLEANMEVPEELQSIIAHNADGIGLYRSEFLFIEPHDYPTEEEQFQTIKGIVEAMEGRSVVVRTLDLGGDKVIPGYKTATEPNPILGWRAVRFCLAKPSVFKPHLRAIYRASVFGGMKIMFPMVSGLTELERVLKIVDEVKNELARRNEPFDPDTPIGVMIEVPSAAITADILARKVDFFSIGTNDLIQYTLAVDRGNERIAYLYEPFHPAVLRLIKNVIDAGHDNGIPVGMCGEMAGDTYSAVILLGLGLDSFSMSPISIPEVRSVIRSVSMEEARELTARVMTMGSCREIDRYVRVWMEERFEQVFG